MMDVLVAIHAVYQIAVAIGFVVVAVYFTYIMRKQKREEEEAERMRYKTGTWMNDIE